MIWHIGVAIILIGYIVAYWGRGITHPIPITLAYWLISLPGMYFLVRAAGMPFAFLSRQEATPLSQIDQAGFYLFSFLVVVALSHFFFSKIRMSFPIVEAVPRIDFALLSGVFAIGLIISYAALNGVGALLNGVALRAFASKGVGAYFEIILDAIVLVAIVQVCETRSKWAAAGFLCFIFFYSTLLGRTGLIVVSATTFLGYLCVVYRVVPIRTVLITSGFLVPFALAQGVLRLRGQISLSNIEWLFEQIRSNSVWSFVIEAISNRVNQLNAFAALSEKLNNGSLATDPLEPIYVFAQVVPRWVWPDKPLMFTDQITNFVAPRVHEAGTVFNFVGPSELMYAFGIFAGIVLTGILYGYLFAVFDLYYRAGRGRPAVYIFFVVMIFAPFGSATQAGFFNSPTMLMLIANGMIMMVLCRFRILPREEIALAGRSFLYERGIEKEEVLVSPDGFEPSAL